MLTQEQESVVKGILEYSLKPYAKMNNIDIVDANDKNTGNDNKKSVMNLTINA